MKWKLLTLSDRIHQDGRNRKPSRYPSNRSSGRKIRTPTPAERFNWNGLKSFKSLQALPRFQRIPDRRSSKTVPTGTDSATPSTDGSKRNHRNCSHRYRRYYRSRNLSNRSFRLHRYFEYPLIPSPPHIEGFLNGDFLYLL